MAHDGKLNVLWTFKLPHAMSNGAPIVVLSSFGERPGIAHACVVSDSRGPSVIYALDVNRGAVLSTVRAPYVEVRTLASDLQTGVVVAFIDDSLTYVSYVINLEGHIVMRCSDPTGVYIGLFNQSFAIQYKEYIAIHDAYSGDVIHKCPTFPPSSGSTAAASCLAVETNDNYLVFLER